MKTNNKQLITLLIGIVLFAFSELFPPWLYKGPYSTERSTGYHFIFSSEPKVKSQDEMERIFSAFDRDGTPYYFTDKKVFSVKKDIVRLYGQRLIILFTTAGVLLVFSERRSVAKLVFGGSSISVGVMFICLYALYVSNI